MRTSIRRLARTARWGQPRPAVLAVVVAVGAAVAVFFFGAPLVALVARWVASGRWLDPLTNPAAVAAIALTIGTTAASLALILVLGTPLAYVLARWRFPGLRLVRAALDLPMVLPPAVAGLALLMAFGRRGLLGAPLGSLGVELAFTTAAVVMAQCFVAGPLYVRSAAAALARVHPEMEEAALIFGASQWEVFRWITVPLVRSSLAAGVVLAWARAVGEFGATILFAGSLMGRTQTMSLAIYSALEVDLDLAVALAVILLGVSGAILALMRLLRVDV